ncbi:MAG: outer membrane protein, partial [Hyphomonadaceae bacterium]
MRSTFTKTVAIAALLAGVAGAAHATEGWYGQGTVGYGLDGSLDGDVVSNIPANSGPLDYDFDDDWMGAASLGYAFVNGFRLEGELSYRTNDMSDGASPPSTGDVNAWAGLINLIYDFNRQGQLQPYLGVGVGAARVDATFNGVGSSDDTVFAYQAMAGLGIVLSPRLTLDIGYRYLAAPDVGLNYAIPDSPFVGSIETLKANVDYEHQAAVIGLRWQFAAPPPPPPPPAPP